MSDSQKEKLNLENTRKLNKIKRKNAKLFPIYKMFSWDLLFFYSIEFLFYTIAKKLTASEILMINGALLFFKIAPFTISCKFDFYANSGNHYCR